MARGVVSEWGDPPFSSFLAFVQYAEKEERTVDPEVT